MDAGPSHTMHSDDSHEAIPLMAQGEYVHDFHRGVLQVHAQPFKLEEDQELGPVRSRWSRSAIFLSLACLVTALSLVFNAVTFVRSSSPRSDAAAEKLDVSELRRPSLYLGLERVPELLQEGQIPVAHERPVDSPSSAEAGWPSQVARVNIMYPNRAFPHDGWVLLTEQDQTTMEFAALPIHAGQRCALQAYFPARRDLRDKLLTIERDDGIASHPAIRFIPLSPTPASLGNVTWNTRPSESRLIDTPLSITAAFGHNQSTVAFPCPSSAPLRLQAMCVGSGCRLEYDTSPALVNVEPLLGIRLVVV